MPGHRVPIETLKARGTYRKDRHGHDEPLFVPHVPTCPDWLSKEAKAEWRRQTKQLSAVGLVADVDRAMLAAYCEAWAEFVELSQEIETQGRTITSSTGRVKTHPRVAMRNAAFERMAKISVQFGFAPMARRGLKPQKPPATDPGTGPELYKIRG